VAAVIAIVALYLLLVEDDSTPQLQVTRRDGNRVTILPGQLGSSDAFCNSDEVMLGGGYGSSSPGVRAKDVQIVVGDPPKWRVNAYNHHASRNVVAHTYCGKFF
jgi:hypothetical protein